MARPQLPDDGETPYGEELRTAIYGIADALDQLFTTVADLKRRVDTLSPSVIVAVPVPSFSVTPTSGTFPLTVRFSDSSSNNPTGWLWSFGDGTTSADPNPTHTYVSAGTYRPTLVVSNSAGASPPGQTPTGGAITINVTAPAAAVVPAASFSVSATSGSSPFSVFFNDTSTNNPTSWLWTFDDGTTSTEQNPVKTFTTVKSYNVTLVSKNSAGTSNTATATITATTAAAPTTGLRAAISTAAPSYANAVSAFGPDSTKHSLSGALPTNAWFENFMVGSGHEAINIFPYEVKSTVQGLDMCVPPLNTTFPNSVLATMLQTFSFQSIGTNGQPQPTTTQKLTSFSDLGCKMTWTASGGSMNADIVRGMGMVSMNYTNLRPYVYTQNAILSVNGTAVGDAGTFTGTKFKFALNNGQTWIMYTTSSVTFTMSLSSKLVFAANFSGTIRLAILPTGATESSLDSSVGAVPTGGSVTLSMANNTATQTFSFTKTGTGNLLMYALPHHQRILSGATYLSTYKLRTLRGEMIAVSGDTWTLQVPMPSVGWNPKNPIQSGKLAAVQSALTADASFVPHMNDPYFGGKQGAKAAHLALIADQVGNTGVRDTLVGRLRTWLNTYLGGTAATKLFYDTAWGGVVSEKGLTDQGADFGNGMYNDHHFHYGYVIYAAAVMAKFDPSWATTANKAKINDLIRDIANPSNTDTYFTQMRHWDWYEGHSWAAGHFEFGDNRNSESTSEGVNAYYGIHLWGVATANTQLTNLGRFLMASEILTAQVYWQVKQSDTIYPEPFKKFGVVGIVWSNKVDHATWFGAQQEYINGIQMIPTNPTTEALVDKTWMAEQWPNQLLPLWSRTSVWRADVVSQGSGYVPSQNSGAPAFQGFSNGLVATGGSGSGLQFNVNITPGGQLDSVYIVFDKRGTGYQNGEVVQLNGSGGSGGTVRVWTQPEDGWKALLLGGYAPNNSADAWTRANALTGWDDGSSKTQVLHYIASQV